MPTRSAQVASGGSRRTRSVSLARRTIRPTRELQRTEGPTARLVLRVLEARKGLEPEAPVPFQLAQFSAGNAARRELGRAQARARGGGDRGGRGGGGGAA